MLCLALPNLADAPLAAHAARLPAQTPLTALSATTSGAVAVATSFYKSAELNSSQDSQPQSPISRLFSNASDFAVNELLASQVITMIAKYYMQVIILAVILIYLTYYLLKIAKVSTCRRHICTCIYIYISSLLVIPTNTN